MTLTVRFKAGVAWLVLCGLILFISFFFNEIKNMEGSRRNLYDDHLLGNASGMYALRVRGVGGGLLTASSTYLSPITRSEIFLELKK